MKKINSKKSILSAVFCLAMAATLTPADAAMFDNFPNVMDNAMQQGGMNQVHDTNFLKDRYQQREHNEDYQKYENRRNLEANPEAGNQIIKNTNPYNSFQQATVEELDTKGVYVNQIEVAPSEILTREEINSLVQPLVGKNVFIEDIQRVIDDINNLYAEKGFVTARAFLPEQTVENGNIYIGLTESKIGNITVLQNRWTKDGYVTRRLPEKEGQLFDIVELEKDVLDFNRYNEGIRLSANLKAGEKPGTTDIDVVADESFPFHLMGVFDNAGRYSTGSLRGGAMIYADSLFGHRDRLSLGSYFSGGAQSPFIDYNFPINKSDGRIGMMFSSTFANVKWGPYSDVLDIRSRAYQYSLYYTQPLVRKTGFELKSYAGLNYKMARTFMGIPAMGINDIYHDIYHAADIDNITSAEVALMARKDTKYGIWYLSQNAYYSFPIFNSTRDNNYFKYSGSVTRLHDFSHGIIGHIRGNYQVVPGNKNIPYLDQMQTGGLVTVRGYSEGLTIGKNGYFFSGELMFPLMPREISSPRTGEKIPFIGKYVKGAIFADTAGIFPASCVDHAAAYSKGYSDEGSFFAASVGAGLRLQLPMDLTARLYWGFPLLRNTNEKYSKAGRFHFEMTLSPNIDALLASRSTKVVPVVPQTQFQKEVEAEYVNNYDDIRHYDYFRDGGGGAL